MSVQLLYRNVYRKGNGQLDRGYAQYEKDECWEARNPRRNLIGLETIAIGKGSYVVVFFEPVYCNVNRRPTDVRRGFTPT